MTAATLQDRLAALPSLSGLPRTELDWLADRGQLETHESGTILGRSGDPVPDLWIALTGSVVIRVDRGAGSRVAMNWKRGDVLGNLPYSRMTSTPGEVTVEEHAELLAIAGDHLMDMRRECPEFTAHTVHIMLDRARRFNAGDLQDEKMISLGKLAAGLAHEINNPASAIVRSADLLLAGLSENEDSTLAVGGSGLPDAVVQTIEGIRARDPEPAGEGGPSPIEIADREDDFADWLEAHGLDHALAGPLADTPVTISDLDGLAETCPSAGLEATLRWLATGHATRSLADEIREAGSRIHDLVSAVKRFSYMDSLSGPEPVDVETGLRDTVTVMTSRASEKDVTVTLRVESELPRVHSSGADLNQVWASLLDNALDAAPESGSVEVYAETDLDRVVVRVVDDGPGIPADTLPRIFDPFFTTKPPGQGTGLGLQITQQLLRRHRGEIVVDSRPGRTEFRVSLPTE